MSNDSPHLSHSLPSSGEGSPFGELVPFNAAPPELSPEVAPTPPPAPKPLKEEEALDLQYFGPRDAQRPLAEALLHLAKEAGKGSKGRFCETHVTFERAGHAFAVIKPGARGVVDFALALPEHAPPAPWKRSSKFASVDRITHRRPVTSFRDIDGALVLWVEEAFAHAKAVKAPKAPKSSSKETPMREITESGFIDTDADFEGHSAAQDAPDPRKARAAVRGAAAGAKKAAGALAKGKSPRAPSDVTTRKAKQSLPPARGAKKTNDDGEPTKAERKRPRITRR